MNFQEFLKANGWKPNRENDDFFSSLVIGGIDVRYMKDDKIIIWGLHDRGKPPTLIYPRRWVDDNETNKFLESHTNEEILKAIGCE